jgi:NodT family efflux transporter outer membrane factor (OMF) lipoprotein
MVLTVILTIAGCASTRNIGPEDALKDPSSLDAGVTLREANADAGWPSSAWWRSYNDPQLDAWIARAQAGNPSLALAAARVREARSLAGVAAAALAPQVDGSLAINRQRWPENGYYGPGPYNNVTTWNNTAALQLSYNLDLWGRDRSTADRALDAAHSRAADARAAQLELEANVVRAYIGLSQGFALRDIAQSTLEQQQKIAARARRRLQGGIGTQLEVAQAEASLPDYERQLETYNEAIALSRNQLAALAGAGPGAGDSITRPVLSLATPLGLPSALPAELIGRRPDVVAARWTVAAQARGIEAAKAQFYPNINLMASLTQMSAGGALLTFLTRNGSGWNAGPAVTLPIFEGGRLRSELGAASAQYDQAVDQYNATLVAALRDVADQVVRLQSLDKQLDASGRSVVAAQKSYRLADEGYQRGLTDYLNVLVAQTQLLRAQDGEARVRAERLAVYATLSAALGGGIDSSSDSPTDSSMHPAKHISPLAERKETESN